MSPSTSTITFTLSHPSEVAALVPSSTDLPDLQKLWDCPNICHVPGPNGPLLQMKCLYCGTVFSHVHSTCMLKQVLKRDEFRYVKLKFLINFLPNTRSCTLRKKDSQQQRNMQHRATNIVPLQLCKPPGRKYLWMIC